MKWSQMKGTEGISGPKDLEFAGLRAFPTFPSDVPTAAQLFEEQTGFSLPKPEWRPKVVIPEARQELIGRSFSVMADEIAALGRANATLKTLPPIREWKPANPSRNYRNNWKKKNRSRRPRGRSPEAEQFRSKFIGKA